ncbi:hypothetical protein [Mycolicibacterium brisbanense]|uniref:Uncharacterized protein n=1 Tax=Mycolicibacterium brisbanense TaxID=146020 RepID=A0A117I5U6_9MYCO|nr:hypothetical protein [Mycolicibacterium brisbanense]MCV7160574.1 hypothetical protein [Mycolicibacterium brisbanense]GAS89029.1 uncharacterized protein RMCB_3125 [Mycolicibacterium brisbanense]
MTTPPRWGPPPGNPFDDQQQYNPGGYQQPGNPFHSGFQQPQAWPGYGEAPPLMVATKVPGQPGSVMFVVSLEQGYPGAPDPGLVDQLVGTLRRAG